MRRHMTSTVATPGHDRRPRDRKAGIAAEGPASTGVASLQALANASPAVARLTALQGLADGDRSVAQRRAVEVGAEPAAARVTGTAGGEIRQMALLDVGQSGVGSSVRSSADVQAAAVRGDTLLWPSDPAGKDFNADYGGSVRRAMDWGLAGGEGTGGWYGREYAAADFHAIGVASGAASNALPGLSPALDNEPNRTLVAIRAFRGPSNGAMAGQTQADLNTVRTAVTGHAGALHAAGLITDPTAAVTEIRADPAEAHPNTLPTAKVTFGGAGTVYFKGRSNAPEDALVGTGASAAGALSQVGGADGAAGVGMHGFTGDATTQIAGDVGAEVAPEIAEPTMYETALSYLPAQIGGADVPPRPQAIAGWLSAAKSALLAALTATTDLHRSNIVAGRSGQSHMIDAEFLLDVTQWQAYVDMAGAGPVANFNVADFAPPWLIAHTATLSVGTKALLADAVVAGFNALHADSQMVQDTVLAPINALIQTPAKLRVIPLGTNEFLAFVTYYNNAANAADRTAVVDALWQDIGNGLGGNMTLANAGAGKAELGANLGNGMVPLFHVQSDNGAFLLNKQINIGQLPAGRTVAGLLTQTKAAVTARIGEMAVMVSDAVKA